MTTPDPIDGEHFGKKWKHAAPRRFRQIAVGSPNWGPAIACVWYNHPQRTPFWLPPE
jgi:hypothetical protein